MVSGIYNQNYGINIIETNVLKYALTLNKQYSKQTFPLILESFWGEGDGNKGNFMLKVI